jgi:preprotein translocase subunit Sec63
MTEGPAETTIYMLAGYGVIFGVMLLYLVSLVVRWRNLRQDEEMIKQLEDNQ